MPIPSFLSKVRNRRRARICPSDARRRRRQVSRLLGGEQLEERRLLTAVWQYTTEASEVGSLSTRFGDSVALDRGHHVVGSPSTGSGEVYVFDTGTGSLVATLENPVGSRDFGRSVAISRNHVVVGAPGGVGGGRAYVFNITDSDAPVVLGDDVAGIGANFGDSVAISGGTVVVGDSSSDQVYLFDADSGDLKATLDDPDTSGINTFGNAVAIFNDTIVVGDDGDEAAYIFDADSLDADPITLSASAASDGFGYSVAVAGDTVVVGAPTGNGAAFIFDASDGDLIAPLSGSGAFGFSVAVAGDKVTIGAPAESGGGQVHVFDASDGRSLATVPSPEQSDNIGFGRSVAMAVDQLVVGDQGAVSVFGTNTAPEAFPLRFSVDAKSTVLVQVANGDWDRERNLDPTQTVAGSDPDRGILTNNGDGSFTFDSNGAFDEFSDGEVTTVEFGYQLKDRGGSIGQSIVVIEVGGLNDAPQALRTDIAADEDGAAVAGQLLADDVDNDDDPTTLIYMLDVGPNEGIATVNEDGSFTFHPDNGFQSLAAGETGTDFFTFVVTDSHGFRSEPSGTAVVTVTGVNDAPTAQHGLTATGREDRTLTGRLSGDDPDSDDDAGTLTYSKAFGPSGLTVHPNGSYTFDPGDAYDYLDDGESEDVLFTYRVTDRHGISSGSATVILTVTGVNDPPTASNLTAAAAEDGDAISDDLVATDVADAPLVYQRVGDGTAEGTATVDADGSYTFDPGDDFQDLAAGETRDVSFTYQAVRTGDGVVSNTATVVVTVTGTNDVPVAQSGAIAAVEGGGAVGGQLVADDIDSDDDSGSLAYELVDAPAAGTATVAADGSFTFDPGDDIQDLAEDETRTFRFTYKATDSHDAVSNTATVVVTVTGANDAPTAVDGEAEAREDGAVVHGQLSASDPGNDSMVYALVSGPSEGTVTVDADGSYTFDPGSDFQDLSERETREVVFTFRATDIQNAESNLAEVTVTITGVNDAPLAIDDTAETDEDDLVTIDVLANDIEVDEGEKESGFHLDGAAVISTTGLGRSPAVAGQVSVVGNQLIFNPGTSFETLTVGETATATIEYRMSDGRGGSSTATVVVTVAGTNDASALVVFLAPGQEGRGAIGRPVQFAGAFADLDSSGGHQVKIEWNDGRETLVDLPDFDQLSLGDTFESTTDDGVVEIIGLSFDVVVFLTSHSFSTEGGYAVTFNVDDGSGFGDPRTSMLKVVDGSLQNPMQPLDVDGNTEVTPLDALVVINALNRRSGEGLVETMPTEPTAVRYVDVNGDGVIGPLDALRVINYLNRGDSPGDGTVPGAVPDDYLTSDNEPAPPRWIVESVWRVVEGDDRDLPTAEGEADSGAAFATDAADAEFRGTSAARPHADPDAVDSVFESLADEEHALDAEIAVVI